MKNGHVAQAEATVLPELFQTFAQSLLEMLIVVR